MANRLKQHIVAIDPGGTTGIATYHNGDIQTQTKLVTETIVWLDKLHNNFDVDPIDVVVIEFFATAGRLSKYGLATIDLVGQVKGYCFAEKLKCVTQSPMSRKSWIMPAERLLGFKQDYHRPLVHEIDALAHLLQYLESKHGIHYSSLMANV